jgi:hypothetical protein
MSALDRTRLMERLERLPTKYPILYVAMTVFLPDGAAGTGSSTVR